MNTTDAIHCAISQDISDFLNCQSKVTMPTITLDSSNSILSTSHESALSYHSSHLQVDCKRQRDNYLHHTYQINHTTIVSQLFVMLGSLLLIYSKEVLKCCAPIP